MELQATLGETTWAKIKVEGFHEPRPLCSDVTEDGPHRGLLCPRFNSFLGLRRGHPATCEITSNQLFN